MAATPGRSVSQTPRVQAASTRPRRRSARRSSTDLNPWGERKYRAGSTPAARMAAAPDRAPRRWRPAGRGARCGARGRAARRGGRAGRSRARAPGGLRRSAEHEERGLHAGAVEGVEHRRRVRTGPVVEGEGDLRAVAAPAPQARSPGVERRPQRVGGERGEREGDRGDRRARERVAASCQEGGAAEERGECREGEREEGQLAGRHGGLRRDPAGSDRAIQLEHLPRDARPGVARRRQPAARAVRGRERPVEGEPLQRSRPRGWIVRREELALALVLHHLAEPVDVGREHRPARAHGLEERHAERGDAGGRAVHVGGRVPVRPVVARDAREHDIVAEPPRDEPLVAGAERTVPDDEQPGRQSPRRSANASSITSSPLRGSSRPTQSTFGRPSSKRAIRRPAPKLSVSTPFGMMRNSARSRRSYGPAAACETATAASRRSR